MWLSRLSAARPRTFHGDQSSSGIESFGASPEQLLMARCLGRHVECLASTNAMQCDGGLPATPATIHVVY
jgi:hypothetical protein